MAPAPGDLADRIAAARQAVAVTSWPAPPRTGRPSEKRRGTLGAMSLLATGYLVTGAVSLLLLGVAWRWPRRGRLPFALLFLSAAAFNAATALRDPDVYVTGFAPHAFPPMREFIERVVALAPGAIVLAIAAGQITVGICLAVGRGRFLLLGVAGAACFLVGISWLGVGAALPLNLVLAAGVLLLLRGERR